MMYNPVNINIADIAVCTLIILICALIIISELIRRRHIKSEGGCSSSCGYCSGGCAGCRHHQGKQQG